MGPGDFEQARLAALFLGAAGTWFGVGIGILGYIKGLRRAEKKADKLAKAVQNQKMRLEVVQRQAADATASSTQDAKTGDITLEFKPTINIGDEMVRSANPQSETTEMEGETP